MSNDPAMIWPENWVTPAPVYIASKGEYYAGEGFLWYGREDGPTVSDYEALDNVVNGPYEVDELTLVGRYRPKWSTAIDEELDTPREQRAGGYGSQTYQMQKIFPGASLTDEPIWIHGDDGSLEKIVPPNMGLYWVDDNQLARAGARPGSVADEYIGEGQLYYDSLRGLYLVR